MLNLYQKIQKIESLLEKADRATASFKKKYNIECLEHCSKCCHYNGINASPIEFLPLAWHYYKSGKIDELVDKLSDWNKPDCVFAVVKDGSWGCSAYPARGMICRLFGFASTTDKHGKPCYAVCRTLKDRFPEKTQKICEKIHSGGKTPIIADFYRNLSMLDLNTGEGLMPINRAIKKACEIVYLRTMYKRH